VADIFVSYSKKDVAEARLIAALLEGQGYSVWWDRKLVAGNEFRRAITEQLDAAKAVIVLWTENSVNLVWVKAEAQRAYSNLKLVPLKVRLLRCDQIPLPFSELHTADFDNHEAVLAAVKTKLSGQPASVVTSEHEVSSQRIADLPIRELFAALAPNIPNAEDREHAEIASQVRDQLALGRLIAWGRDDAAPNTSGECPPLMEIKREYWEKASLHPFYFLEEHRLLVHAYAPPKVGGPQYRDICFNRAQTRRLWPFLSTNITGPTP
jgi:hypothetical protein